MIPKPRAFPLLLLSVLAMFAPLQTRAGEPHRLEVKPEQQILTAQEYFAAVLKLRDSHGTPLRNRVKPAGARDKFGELADNEEVIVFKQLKALYRAGIPVERVQQWVSAYDAGRAHDNIFRRLASLATRPGLFDRLNDMEGRKDSLGRNVNPHMAFRYCAAGAQPDEITAQSLEGRALVILSYSDFNGALEVQEFAELLDNVRQSYRLSFVLAKTPADVQAAIAKHRNGPRIIAGHPVRGGIELMRESPDGILSTIGAQTLVEHLGSEALVVYSCRGGERFAPALAAGGARVIGSTVRFTAAQVSVTGARPLKMEFHLNGRDATYDSARVWRASQKPMTTGDTGNNGN
jgi:hypothetical protein